MRLGEHLLPRIVQGQSASSTFEIDWGLDQSLQTIFINERPLCWVHATLVANRSGSKCQQSTLLDAHDLRIKVETAEAIKTGSKSQS